MRKMFLVAALLAGMFAVPAIVEAQCASGSTGHAAVTRTTVRARFAQRPRLFHRVFHRAARSCG